MTTFSLPDPSTPNEDKLLEGVNHIGQHFFVGDGAPNFTPPGRAWYLQRDGGVGTTFYVYSGAAWNAVAGV